MSSRVTRPPGPLPLMRSMSTPSSCARLRAAGEDPEPHNLRRQYVERHLEALSSGERELIFLAYYEGLTQEEIAARLDEPLGTIKSRVRAALQKLRSSFAGEAARA